MRVFLNISFLKFLISIIPEKVSTVFRFYKVLSDIIKLEIDCFRIHKYDEF